MAYELASMSITAVDKENRLALANDNPIIFYSIQRRFKLNQELHACLSVWMKIAFYSAQIISKCYMPVCLCEWKLYFILFRQVSSKNKWCVLAFLCKRKLWWKTRVLSSLFSHHNQINPHTYPTHETNTDENRKTKYFCNIEDNNNHKS